MVRVRMGNEQVVYFPDSCIPDSAKRIILGIKSPAQVNKGSIVVGKLNVGAVSIPNSVKEEVQTLNLSSLLLANMQDNLRKCSHRKPLSVVIKSWFYTINIESTI